jgi:hypothetical protein
MNCSEQDINDMVLKLAQNNKKIQTEDKFDMGYSDINFLGSKQGEVESINFSDISKFKQKHNEKEIDSGY